MRCCAAAAGITGSVARDETVDKSAPSRRRLARSRQSGEEGVGPKSAVLIVEYQRPALSGAGRVLCWRWLRIGDTEVATDLPREEIVDFAVTGNR